jgi:alcohol dehydrogenase class IV
VADIWSLKAIDFAGKFLVRAVQDGDDTEARGTMMLGATMAGIGFGTAGVHIPHSCAYPLAGLKHSFHAPGYAQNHGFVPHGYSVIVTAPAVFRLTYAAAPEKHIEAARLLTQRTVENPGPESLPNALIEIMRAVGAPAGIEAIGYTRADIPAIVEGALKQQRLLALAPIPVNAELMESVLTTSLANW